MKPKTFRYDGHILEIHVSHYEEGGAPAVVLLDAEDGSSWAKLTVNVQGVKPVLPEILVKTWSENEPVARAALASGLFEDTGRRVPTGRVEAQIWRVRFEVAE